MSIVGRTLIYSVACEDANQKQSLTTLSQLCFSQ